MIAAAFFQHIWECIESRWNIDRLDFKDAFYSNNIYKWIAFTWVIAVPCAIASDSESLEIAQETNIHCLIQEELAYSDSAATCDSKSGANEIWEISTRHLPQNGCRAPLDASNFRVSRWQSDRGWIESSFEQYLASIRGSESGTGENNIASSELHNIVYVHGNWMPADLTRERGLLISRYLAQRDHLPFRFTIFSWPSTREKHALADVRENAIVAEVQGLYLASFLQHMPAERPLGIIGFSYGARAVTGALHALGGGTLCGRTVTATTYPREIRISLMAAAIDRGWLLEGGRHQFASQRITSIVNLYNSNDPVLRRYHLISTSSRATAAGVAGLVLPRNWLNLPPAEGTSVATPNYVRLQQFDCRSQLGRSHDERSYYRECSCTIHLMDHVLWND